MTPGRLEISRRRLLTNALFGAGWIGLRSLATGIPASILASLDQAVRAGTLPPAPPEPPARPPQYVILASSADGDPINANSPGMYLDPRIGHPASPEMAPAPLMLSGTKHVGARPWSLLPQPLLDRLCFFQHATYTVIHSDEAQVLQLMGHTTGNEMFASLLASKLAPALGTIQTQPVVLGPRISTENLIYQGSPQPIISPSALSLLLGAPDGPLGRLQKIRDRDLNSLNALLASDGTAEQAAFIDQYVQSQSQLRSVSESILSSLAGIRNDDAESQVVAAVALIRMNVAPLISIHIPFGADNHSDPGLGAETAQTVSGVAAIGKLWSELSTHGLLDRVSFLSLNVFGRTLSAQTSADGRQHNADHHTALMFGAPFRGGVIGGVEPSGNDFGAMSIDSVTGAGVPGGRGDRPSKESLQSMCLTFGAGVGVDRKFLAANIKGGAAVGGVLRG